MMKVKSLVLITLALSYFIPKAQAGYNIVDRMRLTDDRFKTLDMLRPFGHDFLFDVNAAANSDTKELIDDAKKIGKLTGSTSEQISQADSILQKHYDTEKFIRARFNLGIPIFSFSAFGLDIQPNFRIDGGLSALINTKRQTTTFTSLIDSLEQIPASVRTAIKSCNLTGLTDGDDVLAHCVSNGAITQAQADAIKSAYGISKIPYYSQIVNSSQDLPVVDTYIKADVKAGLVFDYKKDEHWFGQFSLMALGRADIRKVLDATLLIAGGGGIDLKDPNTLINAILEYKLGYRHERYAVFAALEEVKLFEISSEDTEPVYGTNPLIRLQGQADFRLGILSVMPFLGTHARKGYTLAEAAYLGADWGAHIFNDKLGIKVRTMVDQEHFTIGPRLKFWLIEMDFLAKVAIKGKVDGVKVSEIYSADFRIAF